MMEKSNMDSDSQILSEIDLSPIQSRDKICEMNELQDEICEMNELQDEIYEMNELQDKICEMNELQDEIDLIAESQSTEDFKLETQCGPVLYNNFILEGRTSPDTPLNSSGNLKNESSFCDTKHGSANHSALRSTSPFPACSISEPTSAENNNDQKEYQVDSELQVDSVKNYLSFDDLPVEIKQKILLYLSQEELSLNVATVCRYWYQLAYDPIHWQRLTLGFNKNMSESCFQLCLQRAPQLKYLNICWKKGLSSQEAKDISENCKLLRELQLGFCDDLYKDVLHEVSSLPNLHTLNIEGCNLVDSHCIPALIQMKNLKHLNVSHCTRLLDEDIQMLFKSLENLVSLNIDGISQVTDKSVEVLLECHCNSISHLDLDGAEMTDTIMSLLKHCPNLTHLAISFSELLTDSSLHSLREMGQLQSLTIRRGTLLTSTGFKKLFECRTFNQLKKLDLSECSEIRDEAIAALVDCCAGSLKQLSLRWCWFITDVGLKTILQFCRNLELLDLLGLDKIIGQCFVELPCNIPNLKRLDLEQCNRIDDDLVLTVAELMPNLLVINYYGEDIRNSF